jgi:signal transduction histidine kinase
VNRLWVRLSLAFAGLLALSILLITLLIRPSYQQVDQPPPEVIAYFEQLRYQRLAQGPFLAILIIGGLATLAGAALSRTLAAPMSDLERAASDIGRGDLQTRVAPRGSREMVAVASAFNDMASQLEHAESRRRSMLADVAHELRHPLHILQGNLQAMQDGIYPIDQDEIERLISQTRHLSIMVNDLHVLAQAEASRLPLVLSDVDIAVLVKDVAAAYQPAAKSRGIELHVELLGAIPQSIAVDEARLRQAVQNLLENALRHTAENGHITLSLMQTNAQLVIEVADDGDGIAVDQLPYVFERLYRGDPARQRGSASTGLGLPITRAIVQAHGGQITAVSPGPYKGSTFTMTLPLTAATGKSA